MDVNKKTEHSEIFTEICYFNEITLHAEIGAKNL